MKQWWNDVKDWAKENKLYCMVVLYAIVLAIIVISSIVGFTVTSICRREEAEYNEQCYYKLAYLAGESFQNKVVAFIPCNEEIIFYSPETNGFDSYELGESYSELIDLLQEIYGEWDIYLYDDMNRKFSASSSDKDDSESLRILAVERILGRNDPIEPVVRRNYAREKEIRNIIEDLK